MIKIFDGAMGTMLQAAGLAPGACPELMNVERPDAVTAIHRAYLAAGSDIVTTNTFGATALKLAHYDLADRMAEINAAAVHCAQKAAAEISDRAVKIAGDVGPTGQFIAPLGELDFETAYDNFYNQIKALADAGADYIIIETIIDIQEMRAALLAAKAACNLPVICQFSYSGDGRTVTGTDPATAAITVDALGADVIGANCSLGPAEMVAIVKKIAAVTDKPIIIQPNAGMPTLVDGQTRFPMTPDDFGKFAPEFVAAGATFLGGCCGTTPEHIAAVKRAAAGLAPVERPPVPRRLNLTSRSRTVTVSPDRPTVIGERINPTGRKKMREEIQNGSFLMVKKEALGQVRAGAPILDVNMGVGGIDQAAAMVTAVTELAQITDAPLAIDTSDPAVLKAALRVYPGRALINSVSAEPERLAAFLPLAKKYGAAIVCLPLAKDLPKTAAERLAIMRQIIAAAKAAGLNDGDFLLDALVLTVASEADSANEVLATLRGYRAEFGYPTTLGLSNISFGLPNRPLINRAFYAMCLAAGLTAPIMNPYDDAMMATLRASCALLGFDPSGRDYSRIEAGRADAAAEQVRTSAVAIDPRTDIFGALKAAVIDGDKEGIVPLIDLAIEQGKPVSKITDRALTAAMNEIGVDFGAGRVFLPQVLLAAEAMRAAFDRLKTLLPDRKEDYIGTFVIATVKGDIHDLGKNIVAALLANSGFRVVDLGKDVPAAEIVAAAKRERADIVGLCALMTTTMTEIDDVVKALKAADCPVRVMAGGAAVTDDYAARAGADMYAPDGVAAVRLAKAALENAAK